jgi:Na+/H+-dicarboxylate symporter
MLIAPLVFASLVAGCANIGGTAKLGRVGMKTMFCYVATTPIAIAIGLFLANFFQPGSGFPISADVQYTAPAAKPIADVIVAIFPSNPIDSMARSDMLQILVFALFFGVAAVYAGDYGKRAAKAFEAIAEVMYSMTRIVMSFAPIGVFALITITASRYGIAILKPFAMVILCIYLGCLLHAGVVYSSIVKFYCGLSPIWFFKGIKNCLLTAFVTRSSAATLPITIRDVRDNLGASDGICSFMLPLGAAINMDGTALYHGVSAIFRAQVYQIDLTIAQQLGIVFTATLASIGAAGVPGAGIIILAMVLQAAGLPLEGIALLIGIDVILDSARTCINIAGDPTMVCAVAMSEGEILKGDKRYKPIE